MKYFMRLAVSMAVLAFLWACESNPQNSTNEITSPELYKGQTTPVAAGVYGRGVATYEITITNLAPATAPGASQPLSPPVLAAHTKFVHVFKKGAYASSELAQLAEDAVSAPLVEKLKSNPLVYAVEMGAGVIVPGASATVTLATRVGFRKLSLVSMLVNTNDAFAGLDGIHLPARGSKTVYLRTYDAGSEANTESFEHIPGPCCGNPLVRVPTKERIRYHEGITGTGDLDVATYGWNEPIAKVTITRVD